MSTHYRPPYTISPATLRLVGEIGELLGRYSMSEKTMTPRLRKTNRIRSIQSSLAIENNTLTIEQVTAVLNGKRVLGLPREIQEVRNAFAAYERIGGWTAGKVDDFLEAHAIMMAGLVERPGAFRTGGVGIYQGERLIHIGPPARRVPHLMKQLLDWLDNADEHPLIVSSAVHYEIEFIHPFPDGNGRMGRLWQTLILSQWKPLLAYIPVENMLLTRQDEYYAALAHADARGDLTGFVEFVLESLSLALTEAIGSDQGCDQVSDQVDRLLAELNKGAASAVELMARLGLSHRPTFRKNYLTPALTEDYIERIRPESPRSPNQRYRLTAKGRAIAGNVGNSKSLQG